MMKNKINVVLLEPEIPQNTGNIARTCAVVGADLHLIHPLGFSVEEKYVRRAGLDYWNMLNIFHYESWVDFTVKNPGGNYYFATTKAEKDYASPSYEGEVFMVFGPESRGIPKEILLDYRDKNIRIPMVAGARSLNLSNSVAILVYEVLRQNDFLDLKVKGNY